MRKIVNDPRLMTKVCDLYYNKKMSKQQIMDELQLSRPTVARLIDAAHEVGIVQISISNIDIIKHWELERELEEKLGLKEVMIVDSKEDKSELKKSLGFAAADYLQYVIEDGATIGISMGSTMCHIVNQLVPRELNDVTVVPLVGGMGLVRMELHANNIAEKMSRVYNGRFIPLHAPARVSKASIRRELVKEDEVATALKCMETLDVALVGIGNPGSGSALLATGYYKDHEIEELLNKDVVGDMCMQVYDIHGNTMSYKNDNNVIGIDLRKLRKVPVSVGVAGGVHKVPAIKGAIAGRYINTLITDVECAKKLIEEV